MKLIFQLQSVSGTVTTVRGSLVGSSQPFLEQTEPGDDIDEDLVTIRIEEPEVSSKDLGMILMIINTVLLTLPTIHKSFLAFIRRIWNIPRKKTWKIRMGRRLFE